MRKIDRLLQLRFAKESEKSFLRVTKLDQNVTVARLGITPAAQYFAAQLR